MTVVKICCKNEKNIPMPFIVWCFCCFLKTFDVSSTHYDLSDKQKMHKLVVIHRA